MNFCCLLCFEKAAMTRPVTTSSEWLDAIKRCGFAWSRDIYCCEKWKRDKQNALRTQPEVPSTRPSASGLLPQASWQDAEVRPCRRCGEAGSLSSRPLNRQLSGHPTHVRHASRNRWSCVFSSPAESPLEVVWTWIEASMVENAIYCLGCINKIKVF